MQKKEIFRVAKEDKELLEFLQSNKKTLNLTKIVSAYILRYFPLYVSKEICKHFLVYVFVNQEDRKWI